MIIAFNIYLLVIFIEYFLIFLLGKLENKVYLGIKIFQFLFSSYIIYMTDYIAAVLFLGIHFIFTRIFCYIFTNIKQ